MPNSRFDVMNLAAAALLVGMIFVGISRAEASSSTPPVQLLPPTAPGHTDTSSCGQNQVLTYNASNGTGSAINCVPITVNSGLTTVSGSVLSTQNITATGTINAGNATTGAACATKGAWAYDPTSDAPIYCNASLVWSELGGQAASGTWCGNVAYIVATDSGQVAPLGWAGQSRSIPNHEFNSSASCLGQPIYNNGTATCPAGYNLFVYSNNEDSIATSHGGVNATVSLTCMKL